ncbi:Cytidylate kinase [Maioricimonas rarisocia]|uniref:Cytidylate kinase n=1 Tax=Maioricimonas rarisocia TaxID=2528026 RepID=A0A517Z2U9_9PLAN|nr:(d)CMP kinase [Maioricimonas rarisocia]QDU36757.1 Cytidylate kinase [Maioricimonas rarisocia]
MIVTIDGPAGTGKSTAARGLASRLGFEFLDTGAMYRVVAMVCLEENVDPQDAEGASRIAQRVKIDFEGDRTFVDGQDVSDDIRTSPVTSAASQVAQHSGVRDALVEQQRILAAGRDTVSEGRDQGTVVFPDAGCKFFLTADPIERAKRRHLELNERGESVDIDALLREQQARDERDLRRVIAPLKPADDAITIDTTGMDPDQVLDVLEEHCRQQIGDRQNLTGRPE